MESNIYNLDLPTRREKLASLFLKWQSLEVLG